MYLNELDQFVKHTLKCRFYLRYVDDFILVHKSRTQLLEWRRAIEQFLADRLALKLTSEGVLRRLSDGADFLGYIVRPRYLLTRRRVVNNLKMKLDLYQSRLIVQGVAAGRPYSLFLMAPEDVSGLRQTVASYLGHFKHACTHNLLKSLWRRYAWLNEYFFLVNGRVQERFKPPRNAFRRLRFQLQFFRSRLGKDVVMLVRIGKYYELFGSDVEKGGVLLKLKRNTRRRGLIHAGFPFWMRDQYLEKMLNAGLHVAVIEETGPGRFVAERCVYTLFKFQDGGMLCVN